MNDRAGAVPLQDRATTGRVDAQDAPCADRRLRPDPRHPRAVMPSGQASGRVGNAISLYADVRGTKGNRDAAVDDVVVDHHGPAQDHRHPGPSRHGQGRPTFRVDVDCRVRALQDQQVAGPNGADHRLLTRRTS